MLIILRSVTIFYFDTGPHEGGRSHFTLRNLCSKKANQFVSIFSATDSVLQDEKKAHWFVRGRRPAESWCTLIILL